MAHQVHNKIMDLRVRMLMEDVVTSVAIILGVYLYCGFTQAKYFLDLRWVALGKRTHVVVTSNVTTSGWHPKSPPF